MSLQFFIILHFVNMFSDHMNLLTQITSILPYSLCYKNQQSCLLYADAALTYVCCSLKLDFLLRWHYCTSFTGHIRQSWLQLGCGVGEQHCSAEAVLLQMSRSLRLTVVGDSLPIITKTKATKFKRNK